MRTRTRIALTVGVALYVLVALAGSLAAASILPGAWALLTLPATAVTGWLASDMLGIVWRLEGQFDDGV